MTTPFAIPSDLETQHPADIVRWAVGRFGLDQVVVTASFGDAVLAHVAASAAPGIEIVLLDTGYLFAETEWFADRLRDQFDLNLRTVHPLPDAETDLWRTDTDACCYLRKVEPLQRALAGRKAWATGLRRDDSPTRANAPIVAWEAGRRVVKVNPLATWTEDDVHRYAQAHDLPEHPLVAQGFGSIGCWPCTRALQPGEDHRAGRWAGTGKTECGLHA